MIKNKLDKILRIYPGIKEITLTDDDWKELNNELQAIARNPNHSPTWLHRVLIHQVEIKNIQHIMAKDVFINEHQDCVSRVDFEALFKK